MRLFDVKGFTFHIIKWAKINIFGKFSSIVKDKFTNVYFAWILSNDCCYIGMASGLLSIFSQNIKYLIPL